MKVSTSSGSARRQRGACPPARESEWSKKHLWRGRGYPRAWVSMRMREHSLPLANVKKTDVTHLKLQTHLSACLSFADLSLFFYFATESRTKCTGVGMNSNTNCTGGGINFKFNLNAAGRLWRRGQRRSVGCSRGGEL